MESFWLWVCAHKDIVWDLLHLAFAFLMEMCPLLPSCLVLAGKGSMYSLSSPCVSHAAPGELAVLCDTVAPSGSH